MAKLPAFREKPAVEVLRTSFLQGVGVDERGK
jgi:hypothetical protein